MSIQAVTKTLFLLLLAIVLGLAACGDGDTGTPTDPGDPDDPNDPGDPGDPNGTLECQIAGYPCSYSDVPLDVIEATEARAAEIVTMRNGGTSMEEIASWLEGQSDVAEVQHDELALRFRLEGGRATWISEPEALLAEPGPGGSPPLEPPTALASARGDRSLESVEPARHVAGESPLKRAIVLGPMYWTFGTWDDGPLIRDILKETRGYESGVEYHANEAASDKIALEHFMSWRDYQVVHITTHGKRVCKGGVCRAGIDAGLLEPYLPEGSAARAEKIQALETQGLEISVARSTGTEYLRMSADFFRTVYPEGLGETVVFLSSCQSQGAMNVDVDLVDALGGEKTVVLGWSDAVYADDGIAASTAFYESLSERGYPTRVAWERLGDLRVGKVGTLGDGTPPELRLEGPSEGDDLRIREVVTVLNPYSGAELTSGDAVGAIGVAGDGQHDAAPFRVLVEGVLEEHAADVMVHVTVDGAAADPISLADGVKDDEDAWQIQGSVPLPYDLTDDRAVTWETRATLHDGGESRHERDATLSGAEPLMGTTWELTGRYTSYYTEDYYTSPTTPTNAEATLHLTFEPGQNPLEPNPRYVITGGTVFWDYNHVFGDCTRSAPAITFDVTEELSGFGFGFYFDTSTDPPTAYGRVFVQTPWVTVTSACDHGTSEREHRSTHNWFNTDADFPPVPVTEDGTLVRGTYCTVVTFPNGSHHVQRTDYVMRRLVAGDTSEPPSLHEGTCL